MSEQPFKISIAHNPIMGAYDLILLIGNLPDEATAKKFADMLSEWIIGESGWKAKVQ